MKKNNIIIFSFIIAGMLVPAIILVKCYLYSFELLSKELLIAIFTGCVIALPNSILLLYQSKKIKDRKCNRLVNGFVEHYNLIDADILSQVSKDIINRELDYLDNQASQFATLITDYYIRKDKRLKIANFLRNSMSLYEKLCAFRDSKDKSVCKSSLNNSIKFCLSSVKAITNYQDYLGEYSDII